MQKTQQTALVTGASQGIGEVIAVHLARAGFAVALLARSEAKLVGVRSRWPELGDALILSADVRQSDQIERAAALLEERFGHLDVLVNNAGGSFQAPARQLSPNGFLQVVAINLVGPFVVSRTFLPLLEKRGGSIVNIGSTAGRDMAPNMVAYGASKAGLVNMTRSLAAEWGPTVRVNCVAPGPILTPAARQVLYEDDPGRIAAAAETRSVGRLGTPEDVAEAVLWMARASYVNGSVLYVDGGPDVRSVTQAGR
ncbi:SDR family NAD(P)-dependent oxidoreductase [Sulfobacillus harzensis]|uniref:SDR family oxidoreductase n=1 Tax=Sulfobacillus harzensis TaxID=2729629 RepID=A0A7Y0L4S7_9FIRM|nr:SDR family oxidoreductase [Sulfobacillus harzensis]NMP23307.1 SDR family oxidoreductase [Sulfobacillus harzensis]